MLFNALLKWIKPKSQVQEKEKLLMPDVALTQADLVKGLQAIAGLDVKLGMKRVMGKVPLYLNMLNKYVETGIRPLADLEAAVVAHDHATAERIAHTLKGTNGNIGASDLQALADSIETLIKDHAGTDTVMAKVAVLAAMQTAMVQEIANVVSLSKPIADSKPLADASTETLTQVIDPKLLNQLIVLLKDNDTQAMLHLEQHAAVFKAHLTPSRYEKINRALLEFDFEHALSLITH
jgi:two-component system sensor histidine kinase/response regulator